MAAKFEISKDHTGKFRFPLKARTARSSLPARRAIDNGMRTSGVEKMR
jgi:hypothetical protein